MLSFGSPWLHLSSVSLGLSPKQLPHSGVELDIPAALQVYAAVVRHVDWGMIKCLVIAGPGFAKESFRDYLNAEAVRKDTR